MINHGGDGIVSDDSQISSFSKKDCSDNARKRWSLLAQALLKDKENVCCSELSENLVSVRRFHDFGLFSISPVRSLSRPNAYVSSDISDEQRIDSFWFEYSAFVGGRTLSVKIHHLVKLLTPADLMGFNNTGNVCVWPSEEVLAYYCLNNLELFRGKSILELGGGMTCLAGISLAKWGNTARVLLTDGNSFSVGNVKSIIDANELPESLVKASVLKWGCDTTSLDDPETFDFVLAADCLFFDDTRNDLVATIWTYLKDNAFALITAPARGETHQKFIRAAQNVGFIAKLHASNYNIDIHDRHLQLKSTNPIYDEDIHYPLLISLHKPPPSSASRL